MNNKQYIGKLGENKTIEYLQNNYYQIIEKNFYCRFGEIDIIAIDKKENELFFIEVKTRTNLLYGIPIEAVNYNKIKHMKKAINYYLLKRKISNIDIRIDAVGVLINKNKCIIQHIKDAIQS